jgi:hypothetical protein
MACTTTACDEELGSRDPKLFLKSIHNLNYWFRNNHIISWSSVLSIKSKQFCFKLKNNLNIGNEVNRSLCLIAR